ncbi:MAG TPA: nitrite/sulfite reductase [Jiangellales bacterium]|nr:nitrite/sulfite reductase [Jiangellales bacterium]
MSSTTTRPDSGPPKRGEGQWALGHFTPLNSNEQVKKDDDGLHVRARIENVYARRGFGSIDPADLRGRFRWWGLYTQRRPGIPGGRTAVLEPHELEDEYFMLRVRIDGGRLTVEQLRVIADVSTTYARDTADITDRQNIQLHWVRIEDVPEIWRRLEAVGLSTTEACGDVPRVILGSPVAGIAAAEVLDPTWAIEEIQRRYIGSAEFSNLPRKYKSAISGLPDVAHEIQDIAFVGAVHPRYGPGLDVWVGGGLSTNPKRAKRLDAWVPLEEVPLVWAAVTRLYRDYGYRRLRNKARLKFLVDDWGIERFRAVLESEYLERPLRDGSPVSVPERAQDHVGIHQQHDGRFYLGVAPMVGRVSGTQLGKLADIVEAHGSGRIRTTPQQKLIVLDVPAEQVESLVLALDGIGLQARPSAFRRDTMACTGLEFCKLAIVETKGLATATIGELESRLADVAGQLDTPITLNVNGCPNSCARIQVADIGLKGQIVKGEPGFQVHLGGGLGLDAGFGRKPRGLKVTAADLPDYVERLVRCFLAGRESGERFAQWALRADEEQLQ